MYIATSVSFDRTRNYLKSFFAALAMCRTIRESDLARIVPHASSKASIIFGYFSNPILRIKDMKYTITDVPAVTVSLDWYPGVSRSCSKGTSSCFLGLVKLPSSKHGD